MKIFQESLFTSSSFMSNKSRNWLPAPAVMDQKRRWSIIQQPESKCTDDKLPLEMLRRTAAERAADPLSAPSTPCQLCNPPSRQKPATYFAHDGKTFMFSILLTFPFHKCLLKWWIFLFSFQPAYEHWFAKFGAEYLRSQFLLQVIWTQETPC